MNYVPHRYSPKSVYRFVPVIDKVLSMHRNRGIASVSFDPTNLSISMETGIARLRDAVHALSTGMCPHPLINAEELRHVWPLYKVTSDGKVVQVVARSVEQIEPVAMEPFAGVSIAVLRTDDLRFTETITAFAVLLGQHLLVGQVDIVGDLSDSLRYRLESENDIVITADGHQLYHMI
jgi:hypothetical protein